MGAGAGSGGERRAAEAAGAPGAGPEEPRALGKTRMMNKLYIGNLSPAVTADDLRQLFGDRKLPLAGQVLLKSGYAFVDYPDQNWAIRAIETLSGEHPRDPRRASPGRLGTVAAGRPSPTGRARRDSRARTLTSTHQSRDSGGGRAGSGTAGCPAPTAGANLDPRASASGRPCDPPRVPRLAGSLGAPRRAQLLCGASPAPTFAESPRFPFF